ncbi:helix-turn-helix domain-containing protein [Streptomyces sp. FH025]|nr:helix-turn-helix domain-containing protein [Streptomyces sp. FH025]
MSGTKASPTGGAENRRGKRTVAATTASTIRGEDLPAGERFDHWRELVQQTRDSEVTSAHAGNFEAEMRRLELGPVTMLRSSFPAARFRRSERRVRRSDARLYHLTLVLSGGMALTHGDDRTEMFGPGDLHMANSSKPYDLTTFGPRSQGPGAGPGSRSGSDSGSDSGSGPGPGLGEPRVDALGIDFPAALLPVPPHQLRDLFGRRLPAQEGTSVLLSEFLVGLDRQATALGPAEAPRLGTVVVDLVAAWLSRLTDTETALPEEARRRALIESVRAFIRRNLHDPELTPTAVAAAHHISVSYLHRLFGQHSQGETVAAWIRRRRLERAHRDLADPALRTMPVHLVAARWGIVSASDFSRAFRAAYGISPSEHRQRALSGCAGAQ